MTSSTKPQFRLRLPECLSFCFLMVALLVSASATALQSSLPDFTTLVKKNYESVVNISISHEINEEDVQAQLPGLEDDSVDELLRRFREEQRREGGPLESNALGSGFIISQDGYILTNNHVVEGADEVLVRLHDRRQLIARVVGADVRSDVALLKIEASGLPTVSIGNSDELEVGEWVLAIGSPFGFDFSVTAGIVSATGRALPNESYVPFIQTDVAINPGNSGGPLFNLDGDVIGINSQIYSRTGSFMGLSFAIPIEMAIDVADQIRSTGTVTRGWLGVIIQEVTMELAESFGMTRAHGALVASILPDSPAANSTLAVGDVITHFEGHRIERSSSLPPLVGRVPANSDAKLKVVRQGRSIELSVNIGELPSDEDLRQATRPADRLNPEINVLKLTVRPLDDDTRNALAIDKGGVLVDSIEEGGPAQRAGIRVDDVISTIDNRPVDSAREVAQVLAELGDRKSVAVLVHRAEGPVFLAVKLDD
ncbi:DegQ family serine endoprotease [Granulosicoccus antarcticus]|uniref:Probable periplasmic serine endoprotease DegP-like n=1 Tax=Granulosicoccus antarcticus IMCC3135 TaxID=1192854 RepID=A0A2Z2NT25_9GAMM|nr:DegQ family serine endoprotease [Granulosicoccus antarcticus]ASJ74459.1 Putative serine protease HtrA [Granulosicoccus antarcticus IMCC3135]